ncbi:MAG: 50S ribosomal protein L11 methyltransferase [Betaproteobacteria bacterium HGW-Betaproteobacteria-11]|nr:MAG: 50S ribosomal protein L11 methyltransferase [Betaproteobacteria bacterium HGW-Betaproteobacteria-11]
MWVSATLRTDATHVEALSDALLETGGALSVSVEDALAGTALETPQFGEPGLPGSAVAPLWNESRVIALFEPATDLAERIARAAEKAGFAAPPEVTFSEIAEQDWVRLTQAQFDPIRITDRLWIVPSWHVAPEPGAVNLVLDPGLAFGTGSHPTTFLCLCWLAEILQDSHHRPLDLLDYGCGSGILAIAAARLGAARVLGVDIDSNALTVARDNAVINEVTLELRHSGEAIEEQFDLVVANILTNPLCVLAPLLCGRVRPGGRLALSGVLESQAAQVITAYAPWLPLHVGATHDGWVRLEGKKSPC